MHTSVQDQLESIGDVAAWVDAADELCRLLDSDEVVDAYANVVDRLLGLAGADLVTVVQPSSCGSTVSAVAAAGVEARHWLGMTVPVDGSLAGSVLRTGVPRLLRNVGEQLGGNVRSITGVTGLLALPIRDGARIRAVLTIGRNADRTPFTETDLALAGLFTGQLALALTHRDERARLERAVLAGERDRIARRMQTQVIAPLFSLGMRLQGAATHTDGSAARLLEAGSDEIDETLKAIRTTIYRLAD